MIIANEQLKKCLDIANSICYLSRQQVLSVVEISQATLTLYQTYISQVTNINKYGWLYVKHQKGFDRQSVLILCIFKALVKTLGIDLARLKLIDTLKEIDNGN
jgi:hypothetical protein